MPTTYLIFSEGYAQEAYETTDSRRLLELSEQAYKDYGGTVFVVKIIKRLTTETKFILEDV